MHALRYVPFLILLALAARQPQAAEFHLGFEMATLSHGDPLLAVVGGMESPHPAGYGWFRSMEFTITASEGEQRDSNDFGAAGAGIDYRRDAFRYGWGWENHRPVNVRYRVGTLIARERESAPGWTQDRLGVGLFGGFGLEWNRRLRGEILFDTTEHFSLLLAVTF